MLIEMLVLGAWPNKWNGEIKCNGTVCNSANIPGKGELWLALKLISILEETQKENEARKFCMQ